MFIFFLPLLQVHITPIPQKYDEFGGGLTYVGHLFWECTEKTQGKDCGELVKPLKEFYEKAFFPKGQPNPPKGDNVNRLLIELATTASPKSPMVANESYEIVVTSQEIMINAFNLFGLSRALATVAQLIVEKQEDQYKEGLYAIQQCKVFDTPVFPYRMFMVDTARHFLPVRTLKRQLSAMAMAKLNVFHIHLIDTQSNAFNPISKPANEFSRANYQNGGAAFYSIQDMAEIAKFANSLGIFIKCEFDLPGHASSWKLVKPELVANCPKRGYSSVNPINEEVYTYIEAYIKDLFDTIYKPFDQSPLLHLGGDEVDHNCWSEDTSISDYMSKNGITTKQLWQQFHKRVADIVTKLNPATTRFYWQESYNNQNDFTNAIVHSWYEQQVCASAARQKIFSIRSSDWYLNSQQPGQNRYLFVDSMWDFYARTPTDQMPTELQQYSLGGGACQWGEFVNDGNIDEQVWPRTVAVAEVLWSRPASRDVTMELKQRMNTFVCKLLAVGVQSGPIIASAPCPGDFDGIRDE